MLTDSDKINGLPIRAEIRTPRISGGEWRWLTSVVVCQDPDKGTFVVWSIYQTSATAVHAENGIYDIREYGQALEKAVARAQDALR